jgi:two-component system OmpR family response regulator
MNPRAALNCAAQLRSMSAELPIIFLTARDSELDAVSGLRLGADDFPDQGPEHPASHRARERAVPAHRSAAQTQTTGQTVISAAPLLLDGERMQVQWDGEVVLLSLTEFWIVHALARHPGHVRNRQQLMDAANVVLDDNTITSHVKRIRRKFQQLDPKFDAIQTVYGMGYRWVE